MPRLLTQGFLLSCAMMMSCWIKAPWPFLTGLGVLSASLIAIEFTRRNGPDQLWAWGVLLAWMVSFTGSASLLVGKYRISTWDTFHAMVTLVIAAAVLLASNRITHEALRKRLRLLGIAWGFAGAFLCLGISYLQNEAGAFYFGLLVAVVLLVVCKSFFRLPAVGIQITNTLLVCFIGLPVVDLVAFPADHHNTPPEPNERAYSYEIAKRNPAAFARWWQAYQDQDRKLFGALYFVDPGGAPRLRPHGETSFFHSPISINSRGFRGEEISDQKGDAYRIVALGESTTFGLTMNPEDRPWPKILERMIWDRLKPGRPVEVINAGIPGNDLRENVDRLRKEILPLMPDMIISYHGHNGFRFLYDRMPPIRGKAPPLYQRRPLKLLADCEHRLAVRNYRKRQFASAAPRPTFHEPMETDYARAYRELIEVARTSGIRLVLASYSMAVNERSDPDVVEFYEEVFPAIRWQIKANIIHTRIVKQLAQEVPDIFYVDTQPSLDGHHEGFIDFMHFAPSGEQRMAETIFAGIRRVLEEDLANDLMTKRRIGATTN